MIEIAELAIRLKEIIEAAPIPLMLVLVPGFIIGLATVAIAVATFIEAQLPPEEVEQH